MAERTTYPAPGLAGGRAGGRGDVRLNGKRIDNRKQYLLKPGDEIVLRTPGGYGPPRARDKTLAKRDRALGYVLRTPTPPCRRRIARAWNSPAVIYSGRQ